MKEKRIELRVLSNVCNPEKTSAFYDLIKHIAVLEALAGYVEDYSLFWSVF